MTLLRKLTFLFLTGLILFIIFLTIKKIIIAIFFFILTSLVFIKWYQLIIEELLIYKLFRHGKMMKYDQIVDMFGKKAISAIKRLKKKDIISRSDDNILLEINDFKFSFTKWSP